MYLLSRVFEEFFDSLATSFIPGHHVGMRRQLAIVLILAALAFGGIVDDVRQSLAKSNFSGAESQLKSYQASKGVTP